jgi:hypothetical protein
LSYSRVLVCGSVVSLKRSLAGRWPLNAGGGVLHCL